MLTSGRCDWWENPMLARPEWNEERFEAPRKQSDHFFNRKSDRYLMLLTMAAGTMLVLAGLTSLL